MYKCFTTFSNNFRDGFEKKFLDPQVEYLGTEKLMYITSHLVEKEFDLNLNYSKFLENIMI